MNTRQSPTFWQSEGMQHRLLLTPAKPKFHYWVRRYIDNCDKWAVYYAPQGEGVFSIKLWKGNIGARSTARKLADKLNKEERKKANETILPR